MNLKTAYRNISFTTLRVVQEVMLTKSLTKAAKRFDISQPAVSSHLRKFEETTGFSPVLRVGNEMVITSQDTMRILNEIVSLENQLLRMGADNSRGFKVLGICEYWGTWLLTNLATSKVVQDKFRAHIGGADVLRRSYNDGEMDVLILPISESEDVNFSADLPLQWVGNVPAGFNKESDRLRVILGGKDTPFGRTARNWLDLHEIQYEVIVEIDSPSHVYYMCHKLNAVTLLPRVHAKSIDLSGPSFLNDKSRPCSMKVGLLFRDRTVKFLQAEDCFRAFLASVDAEQSHLKAVS